MAPPRPVRRPSPSRRAVRGFMLIEALIAILIFSIGILGIVGLQATAVQQSTEARYRAEAAMLADQLVGTMWASNRTVASLQTQFNTCTSSACPGYRAWYDKVAATLPGVSLTSVTKPTVNVDPDGIVTISVFWRSPGDDAGAAPHRFDVETQIGQ